MRARQRHLNPRDAGANLVLDSRYINQSNNTQISAWADRSVNAYTIQQTDSTARPIFLENTMNGNPVVRFDGTNDFLNGGNIMNIGSRSLSMICVARRLSSGGATLCGKARASPNAGRYSLTALGAAMYAVFDDGNDRTIQVSETSTVPRIFTQVVDRTASNTIFFNGAQQGQRIIPSNSTNFSTTDQFFVGAYQSASGTTPANTFLNGDISQIIVNFVFNSSLRKRMEQSAAFSFKIACS